MKALLGSIPCLLLSGCSDPGRVDFSPIEKGMTFLGVSIVLAALVVVFGKFIGK